MPLIRLDARSWTTRDDLRRALLPALGAPAWHGPNLDALFDGLVAGENRVRPPITVEIEVDAPLSEQLAGYLDRVRGVFDDAARETGLPIALRVVRRSVR